MDIREIQALHAQYSSQPVVIDVASHVRALPTPIGQGSTRERVTARFALTCRRFGRPTAIVLAFALGAGLAGIGAAKLWHVLHPPQAVAHVAPTTLQGPSTAPVQAAASAAAPPGSKRPLTDADFAEPAQRAAASLARINTEVLHMAEPVSSPASANPATPTPMSDLDKAAASPIRASRAASAPAAGQQPAATAPAQYAPAPLASLASASAVPAPAVQQNAQPKPAPHQIHRAPARQRQAEASAEATAPAKHTEPANAEHTPIPSTPAKTGDVPLF